MRLNRKTKIATAVISIFLGIVILGFSIYLGNSANERLAELNEVAVEDISVLFAITKLVELTEASITMFKFGAGISILLIASNLIAILGVPDVAKHDK